MGVQSTRTVTREYAEERVKGLMQQKFDRIVECVSPARDALETLAKLGFSSAKAEGAGPIFGSYITEPEFITIKDGVPHMPNEVLAELLEKLEEDEFTNYWISC